MGSPCFVEKSGNRHAQPVGREQSSLQSRPYITDYIFHCNSLTSMRWALNVRAATATGGSWSFNLCWILSATRSRRLGWNWERALRVNKALRRTCGLGSEMVRYQYAILMNRIHTDELCDRRSCSLSCTAGITSSEGDCISASKAREIRGTEELSRSYCLSKVNILFFVPGVMRTFLSVFTSISCSSWLWGIISAQYI